MQNRIPTEFTHIAQFAKYFVIKECNITYIVYKHIKQVKKYINSMLCYFMQFIMHISPLTQAVV